MRKDYIVDKKLDDKGETEFVRDYWEQIWQDTRDSSRKLRPLKKREQFRIMEPYLATLPPEAAILDAGCGLGEWTYLMHQAGYNVHGLDLAAETIDRLQTMFPDVGFSVGDIRQTNFEDDSFDCIFSWGVFEHFEEGMQPCLLEARRILKPGGLLFISVPHDNLRHGLRSVRDKGTGSLKSGNTRFYQWRFTRAELRIEVVRSDMQVLDIRQICKRDGIFRCLYHEFRLPHEWFLTRALSKLLQPLFPAFLVSHMILGIARKPKNDNREGV